MKTRMGKKRLQQIRIDKTAMECVLERQGFVEMPLPLQHPSCDPNFCRSRREQEENSPFRWIRGNYTVEFGGGVGRITDWQVYDEAYRERGTGHGRFYGHGRGSEALYLALCELPDEKKTEASNG